MSRFRNSNSSVVDRETSETFHLTSVSFFLRILETEKNRRSFTESVESDSIEADFCLGAIEPRPHFRPFFATFLLLLLVENKKNLPTVKFWAKQK